MTLLDRLRFTVWSGASNSKKKLKHGGFHIVSEDGAEDVHNFAQGRVGLDRFDDHRHSIFASLGHAAQILQGLLHGRVVTLLADTIEALKMHPLAHLINVECWDPDILFHDKVVDADDNAFMLVDLLLIPIGRLGDLALEETIEDTRQHATQRIDAIEIVHSRLFRLVRQSFDKVRAAQWINGINGAALIGNDLLSTQGDQDSLLGGESQRLVQ